MYVGGAKLEWEWGVKGFDFSVTFGYGLVLCFSAIAPGNDLCVTSKKYKERQEKI
jgi:hypothetical protein